MRLNVPQHLREEEMVLLFYGEPPEGADAAAHLRACESCRSAYEELRTELALLREAPSPEPEESYGEQVWQRLHPEIERRELRRLDRRPPRWALAAALAASLLVTAGAGVLWRRGTARPAGEPTAERRDLLLLDAVDAHLERAQRLLVELVNEPAAGPAATGSPGVQSWAHELLVANRLYRQLAARQEPDLLPALESLEQVLVEVAHAPDRAPGAAALASSIEARGLLLDLRLARWEVEQKWLHAAGIASPERSL